MSVVRLEAFTYWYPGRRVPALDGVDLDVDGGVVVVTGPSGGGKSTLLRTCNGLVPHFHGGAVRGSASVLGHNVIGGTTRDMARDVGFLFQDPELQSVHARVERDVAFGLENLQVAPALMRSRVDEALHRTGLDALRGRAVRTLSGGERQRLALAGVLAMQPRLLALDEPLSQLDAMSAVALMDALRDATRGGTTVLIAEHRLDQILPLATRALHVAAGAVADIDIPVADTVPPPSRPHHRGDGAAWRLAHVTAGIDRTAVVHDVTLEGGGDVVVLQGPNGGGKTTLLRTLAGLLPPLAGTVRRPPGRVAYLPQNPTSLLYRPTVRDELEWTARHCSDASASDVPDMLAALDLERVADRYPRDLSTGQRQRAALAAVLVGRPSLVLLDEPTRGMDGAARAALCTLIAGLRDRGAAVAVATHDAALAAAVGDRSITVGDGVACERDAAEPVTA